MQFDDQKPPTYIHKHPFRFVKPYPHIFKTHAKKRWLGKQILPTLVKQFAAYDQEYFKNAIENGNVMINGNKVAVDYVIRNSDLLTHSTIREEPPILDLPIEVIHNDEEFLVVNKPPSMIVHTGGGYHYNTLLAILHYQLGYKSLYILHRIDRLTSGVVIMAKQKGKTVKFHEQSSSEEMKKSYFARVNGNFSQNIKILNAPIVCLSHKDGVFSVYDPNTMEHLLKNQQLKQSTTKFQKVWYDQKTNSSLLICSPITGRTHQIRVHLKHLGHCILNDVVYDGRFVGNWVINNIIEKVEEKKQLQEDDKEIEDDLSKKINTGKKQQQEEECYAQKWMNKWDYKTRPWEICLHSFQYMFQGKQYVSSKPYWASQQSIFCAKFSKQKEEKMIQKQQEIQKLQKYEKIEQKVEQQSSKK